MSNVFAVALKHEYGTNIYVATTKELAWGVLYEWAKNRWDVSKLGEIPKDKRIVTWKYFRSTDKERFFVEEVCLINDETSLEQDLNSDLHK